MKFSGALKGIGVGAVIEQPHLKLKILLHFLFVF